MIKHNRTALSVSLIFMLNSNITLFAQQRNDANNWEYNLEYLFDRPLSYVKNSSYRYLIEQQFFLSATFKERLKFRVMLGFPNGTISNKLSFNQNYSWGIGSELVMNKRKHKLFFSLGAEYGINRHKDKEQEFTKMNYLSLVARVSYSISNNFTIIFEPYGIGLENLRVKNIIKPLAPSSQISNPFGKRLLAIGISLKI